ncbi:hypothetical protein [Streptomyces sp. NPDC001770]
MRGEDALEIVRASLSMVMPGASTEGLTRAAEAVIMWGSEDVADRLDDALGRRMLVDLFDAAQTTPLGFPAAEPEDFGREWFLDPRSVAPYREWSHTDNMETLPAAPPDGPHRNDGQGRGQASAP